LGLVLNALTIVFLVAFVFSLRWVRDVPGWVRGWRRTRALAAGRCPRCGYPIVDLPRGVCPECGTAFA
jgi:hypothetical protein